jgi:hypothetical protein
MSHKPSLSLFSLKGTQIGFCSNRILSRDRILTRLDASDVLRGELLISHNERTNGQFLCVCGGVCV